MSAAIHQLDTLKYKSSDTLKVFSEKHRYSNPDLAEVYMQELLKRNLKDNDSKELIDSYHRLGILNQIKGDYRKSLVYFDLGIEISNKIKDHLLLTEFYQVKGNSYLYLNDDKNALMFYKKAIALAKIIKNKEHEIVGYLNIALIKKNIGQFKEALKIEKENIKRAKNVVFSSKVMPVNLFLNLSSTFLNLEEKDSAIYYAKKGLEKSIPINDLEGNSYLYNIIGTAYQNKKEDSIALDYFSKALEIVKNIRNKKRITATHYLIAKSHFSLANFEEALTNLQIAENTVSAIENFQSDELTETYKLFAQIYSFQKKRKQANIYFQKFIQSDSLKDLSQANIIGDLYYKDLQKKESQLQKITQQHNNFKFLLGAGLLLLVIIITVLIRYLKKKRLEEPFQSTTRISKSPAKIDDKKAKEILNKLEKIISKNYFLKSDFSLNSLAKKLKTNPSYLSRVVNTYKQLPFNEYTNKLRIDYAIKRLEEDTRFRSYSILHIARELGYKSQDSFSKHFKKRTGTYPSYYISNLKKTRTD